MPTYVCGYIHLRACRGKHTYALYTDMCYCMHACALNIFDHFPSVLAFVRATADGPPTATSACLSCHRLQASARRSSNSIKTAAAAASCSTHRLDKGSTWHQTGVYA